jgi:hypothetical protein
MHFWWRAAREYRKGEHFEHENRDIIMEITEKDR